MATLNELIKSYVNKDYSELVAIATRNLNNVMPLFNRVSGDNNGAPFAIVFLGTALAVDGKFTDLEYRLLRDLVGDIDYNTALNLVQQHYNTEKATLADRVFDSCDSSTKGELLSLCLCLVAVDETVTADENRFLQRLISD